jgi:hypothetical protein
MQIVFKARAGRAKQVEKLVGKTLRKALPGVPLESVTIRPIFPDVATGQRSRLFTVDLPDQLPQQKITQLVESLRKEDALEYAEIPAAKRPLKGSVSEEVE